MPIASVQHVLSSSSNSLSGFPIDYLAQTVLALAEALHVEPKRALALVARRPTLLQRPLRETLRLCEQAAAAMSLPPHVAMRAVCRQPALLDLVAEPSPPRAGAGASASGQLAPLVARRAAGMAVDKGDVAAMLGRARDAPSLLALAALPSNACRQRLIGVQAVLDSRLGADRGADAVPLVLRNPALLLPEVSVPTRWQGSRRGVTRNANREGPGRI